MTSKIKSIMKRAWEIKSIDSTYFFGLCLKMAWDEAKNNVRLFSADFVTARGADVSVTVEVEHITSRVDYNDGWKTLAKCSEYQYRVERITYKGEVKSGAGFYGIDKSIVKIGMVGNRPLLVRLPESFVAAFKKQDKVESDARLKKMLAAEEKYEAHCAMMRRAMGM